MSWAVSLSIQPYATTGSNKKMKQRQNYCLPILILAIIYWEIHQVTGERESPWNPLTGIYIGMWAVLDRVIDVLEC